MSGENQKHKACESWECKADEVLAENANVMGATGLGVTADVLQELVWSGLKESVTYGYRTAAEAEEIYFSWFNKRHKNGNTEPPTTNRE